MPDTSFVTVFESLVKYSEIFESSYEGPFDETSMNDICIDLESFGFFQGVSEATHLD